MFLAILNHKLQFTPCQLSVINYCPSPPVCKYRVRENVCCPETIHQRSWSSSRWLWVTTSPPHKLMDFLTGSGPPAHRLRNSVHSSSRYCTMKHYKLYCTRDESSTHTAATKYLPILIQTCQPLWLLVILKYYQPKDIHNPCTLYGCILLSVVICI